MQDIYEELVKISARGEEAALVTLTSAHGSTPREQGAKMLVRRDGSIIGTIGGGRIEELVIKESLEVIKKGKPKRLSYSLKEGEGTGMVCGGDVEVFVEPILPSPTLFIFGGGHIALYLASMAKMTGFKIVVIDDRPEFANPERFPEAEQTLVADFAQAFSQLEVGEASYIVIVTHAHMGDEVALEGALKTRAKYIGMIGSRSKNRLVFSHMRDKGFSQELLDRVHAPIGLEINAQTPEEIAVSILAQLIKVRKSA